MSDRYGLLYSIIQCHCICTFYAFYVLIVDGDASECDLYTKTTYGVRYIADEMSCRASTYYRYRYVVNQCVQDFEEDESVSFVCGGAGYEYIAEQHSDTNCGADSASTTSVLADDSQAITTDTAPITCIQEICDTVSSPDVTRTSIGIREYGLRAGIVLSMMFIHYFGA